MVFLYPIFPQKASSFLESFLCFIDNMSGRSYVFGKGGNLMRFWIIALLVVCIAIVFFLGPCTYEAEETTWEDGSQILAVRK